MKPKTSSVPGTPVLLLLTALLAAMPASAQTITSPYRYVETSQSVTVFGGYMFLDPGSQDLGPKDAPFFGARYDLRLTGPISIEAELAYASSERAVRDTVPGETGLVTIGTVDQRFLLASAALRFDITGPRTYRRLQPFLRATGGFAFGLGDGGQLEEELPADVRFRFGTTFATQIGGGIEVHPSGSVTFRLDGTAMLWQIETPRPFLVGARGTGRPDSEWTQSFTASAGMSIRF